LIRKILARASASFLTALAVAGPTSPVFAEQVPVDLELVLAIDVSGSVDWQEAALQRDGYVQALRSDAFVKAVQSGVLGRIAVTYVEWAGDGIQMPVLDWDVIKDQKSAEAFSERLAKTHIESGPWTSISSLIDYAVPLFKDNGYEGTRRVIDISGDGPNNTGRLVTSARDAAVRQGVVINGLPIINDRLQPSGRPQIKDLDKYYRACVIGGLGAFIVVAHDFNDFARAVRRKLIFEIVDATPPEFTPQPHGARSIQPAQAIFELGCDVGERRLQRRRMGIDDEY